jgi:hypothetical protein
MRNARYQGVHSRSFRDVPGMRQGRLSQQGLNRTCPYRSASTHPFELSVTNLFVCRRSLCSCLSLLYNTFMLSDIRLLEGRGPAVWRPEVT